MVGHSAARSARFFKDFDFLAPEPQNFARPRAASCAGGERRADRNAFRNAFRALPFGTFLLPGKLSRPYRLYYSGERPTGDTLAPPPPVKAVSQSRKLNLCNRQDRCVCSLSRTTGLQWSMSHALWGTARRSGRQGAWACACRGDMHMYKSRVAEYDLPGKFPPLLPHRRSTNSLPIYRSTR